MAHRRWGMRRQRDVLAASQEVEAAHLVMDFARGRGVRVANRIEELRAGGLSWRAVLADLTQEPAAGTDPAG